MKKFELVLWELDRPVQHLEFETELEMSERAGQELMVWIRLFRTIVPQWERLGGELNILSGFTAFDRDGNVMFAAASHQ